MAEMINYPRMASFSHSLVACPMPENLQNDGGKTTPFHPVRFTILPMNILDWISLENKLTLW